MQITLSEQAEAAAQAQAADGGFPSVDAYLASLIEADAAVPVSAEVEAELLAGLAGAPGRLPVDRHG